MPSSKNIDLERGRRLKELREKSNHTQASLAKALGLKSKAQISNYEGGTAPSVDILKGLVQIFAVTADYILFGGKEELNGKDKDRQIEALQIKLRDRKAELLDKIEIIEELRQQVSSKN